MATSRRVAVKPNALALGGFNVNDFACRRWRRNRLTVFPKALDVELDRLADECENFFSGLCGSHAAREIGNVGAE